MNESRFPNEYGSILPFNVLVMTDFNDNVRAIFWSEQKQKFKKTRPLILPGGERMWRQWRVVWRSVAVKMSRYRNVIPKAKN